MRAHGTWHGPRHRPPSGTPPGSDPGPEVSPPQPAPPCTASGTNRVANGDTMPVTPGITRTGTTTSTPNRRHPGAASPSGTNRHGYDDIAAGLPPDRG